MFVEQRMRSVFWVWCVAFLATIGGFILPYLLRSLLGDLLPRSVLLFGVIPAFYVLLTSLLARFFLREENVLRSLGIVPVGVGWFKSTLKYSSPLLIFLMIVVPIYSHQGILANHWIEYLVSSAILSSFTEELFYRGFLFQWFRRSSSLFRSALSTGFLFGLVHLNRLFTHPHQAVFDVALRAGVAGAMGFLLCLCFEMTSKSLWSVITLHYVVNLIGAFQVSENPFVMRLNLIPLAVLLLLVMKDARKFASKENANGLKPPRITSESQLIH